MAKTNKTQIVLLLIPSSSLEILKSQENMKSKIFILLLTFKCQCPRVKLINLLNYLVQVIFSQSPVNLTQNFHQYLGCDESTSLLKSIIYSPHTFNIANDVQIYPKLPYHKV